MEVGNNIDIYGGQFRCNILVVGKTGCGKTYFIQQLPLNIFFGNIVKTEWVSGIYLSKAQEAEIQSCFNTPVDFYHAPDQDTLEDLIENFKNKTESEDDEDKNIGNSIYGEKKIMGHLIVTDDVSGIADSSNTLADFLTVSGKYR